MFEIIYRYDPDHRRDRQLPGDPNESCRRLQEGNQSFASLGTGQVATPRIVQMDVEDIGMAGPGGVPVQEPFAVVLGCSDARVPTEMIFDCACNELFVVRVAGNIIGQEQLGSIDYAVEHLGQNLKLIVALGHSQCGAVTAAVDAFLEPAEYLGLSTSHHLRAIVNILFPAVRGAVRTLSVRWGDDVSKLPGYRAALIECSVLINAALMASILRSEFGDPTKDRRVVFGVYDLASRRVHVSLPSEDESEPAIRLMEAPMGREEFRQFAFQVANSAFMTQLLNR
ncbi:MAG TPA: carbonic anhydrase [Blastocatellia bacterium]|nr:carbonic anhydrase [Blastocatellia bacterium]